MAVRVPETAINLRKIANLAQTIQSHALSFFYLSSPDLLLGMDSKPSERNIIGLMKAHPQLARDGVALRRLGQEIIELLSGKRLNSSWIVPGGVNVPLTEDARNKIQSRISEAMPIAQRTLEWYKGVPEKYQEEIQTFANFPSLFMGLVTPSGELEYYHGRLRVVDSAGKIVDDQLDPTLYSNYVGESVQPYSYLKAPYYKPLGFPDGFYRVGPLARLNIIDRTGTPRSEEEWVEYRALSPQVILSNFHNHYARLIEVLYSIERIQQLLEDPNITSTRVRVTAGANTIEGVGVTEAPRGTLIHHYKTNDDGLITWVNLIVATGHNNLAMNHGVLQVAKHFVNNGQPITEGILNRVEAVIRTFDPCLSCSTHAIGKMPLDIRIINNDSQVVNQLKRD
jgi:NAD-reducing hydrogenase large subunit